MRVAVAGGTGVAGRATVEELEAAGHETVVIARSTGVDLFTGTGLAEALEGVQAVVDTTNVDTVRRGKAESFFETESRHLVHAAREAGVGHIVALSIVGIDRVPFGYYQGKLRQEAVLAESEVPVSILRTTQFHEFAAQYLARMKGPVVAVPRWRSRPVSAREVGGTLASLAVSAPRDQLELAGPEEEHMAELVRRVAEMRGLHRRIVEFTMPGAAGRALAAGGALPNGRSLRGTQTFDQWLRRQGPRRG